jgi:BirA family biotin operon repressor/biotin-[acetyl-CoA-carboxylase] ligase
MEPAEQPYESVQRELRGTAFAQIRYERVTESTNGDAAALLGDAAVAGLSIVAEEQTKGAGRKGRSWIATPGSSLLVTTLAPGPMPASSVWIVPFGVAICVRRALRANEIRSELHWPNDLLAQGKKIAGILCVSRVIGERAWVAAGVGINVHRPPGADEAISPPPAFCDDLNPAITRAALLRDLLLNYDIWTTRSRPRSASRGSGNAWPVSPSGITSSKTATRSPSMLRPLHLPTAVDWSSNAMTAAVRRLRSPTREPCASAVYCPSVAS